MAISGSESQSQTQTSTTTVIKTVNHVEVECVKCDSCGFTEECTPAYISKVRQRYQGRWLCGLCVEAVKDEVVRSERLITIEEALNRHISFCKEFRSSSTKTEHPIFVMSRILRRSLDSPRRPPPLRSNSTGVLPPVDGVRSSSLIRSESCFSSISG
ncbi:unnamed protein product [Lathyrus oleraceus]|uniref:DUF1677 family protein n=1 Tax=Pisum sativum TaxID=3888 RepID=A0A9D5AQ27_PEA|nr:uncharacterized protein LOC127138688 [Pisum sativum]KAI5415296.1 hypothetical protein KIW84_040660 [Pisum sativum]